MKLHEIIIGIAISLLVVSGFILFFNDASNKYGLTDYNDTNLKQMNNSFTELENITNDVRFAMQNITDPNTPFDIVGGMFKAGYGSLQTIGKSTDILIDMTGSALDNIPFIGQFRGTLQAIIILLIIASIAIGIFLFTVLKSDRI